MFKETGGWLRGRWPYRPRPQPDETLGSYFARAALGLGVTPVRLVSLIWGSQRPFLYQDLDNHAPPNVVSRICEGADLEEAEVIAMTFEGFEGRLFPNHWPKARKAWILPVSITSNDRARAGLQFCPACLGDGVAYMRRTWRLAFATSCLRHEIALRDRCPTCAAIVHPFRAPSLRHCYRCGGDLCRMPFEERHDEDALATQTAFESALSDGWGHIGARPVHSIAFFAVIRRLATLNAVGRHADDIRGALTSAFGGQDMPFERENPRHPVEYLGLAERYRMFDLARRLLPEWPERFVAVCREARVWRSTVIKDMAFVPFVLDTVLKTQLNDKPYHASDDEVAAAAAWLRRTRGLATYRDLKAHCGESREPIYRHMDYERTPPTPSVWARMREAGDPKGMKLGDGGRRHM